MALGVDQWTAQACIDLGIPFIAACPFDGQEKLWPDEHKKNYRALLKQASEVVYVSDSKFYKHEFMQIRNEWIVDHSDIMVAVWDKRIQRGGTFKCVNYAYKIKKQVIVIDPRRSAK